MSNLYLEPIKARLVAATPGPWYKKQASLEHGDVGWDIENTQEVQVTVAGAPFDGAILREADAELIEHGPTDLADLIAEVESLSERLQVAEELCEATINLHNAGTHRRGRKAFQEAATRYLQFKGVEDATL